MILWSTNLKETAGFLERAGLARAGAALQGLSPGSGWTGLRVEGRPYHSGLSGSRDASAAAQPRDGRGEEIREWERKRMEFSSQIGQGTIICANILIT